MHSASSKQSTFKQYPREREDWKKFKVERTHSELRIGGWQVMQTWERPLMKFLAEQVTWNRGDVLEIGFGMGISAREIIRRRPKSYTVIEAHPMIAVAARSWEGLRGTRAAVIEGFWEDIVPRLKKRFDGILFDTFPFKRAEKFSNHWPFIEVANRLLKPGGRFTYFSDEILPFRSKHLELLFRNFDHVALHKVVGLRPPKNCEYWQSSYMIVPVCCAED